MNVVEGALNRRLDVKKERQRIFIEKEGLICSLYSKKRKEYREGEKSAQQHNVVK